MTVPIPVYPNNPIFMDGSGNAQITAPLVFPAGLAGTVIRAQSGNIDAFTLQSDAATGLNGNVLAAKAGAIGAPNAAGVGYVQADAATWVIAINALRAAVQTVGVTA